MEKTGLKHIEEMPDRDLAKLSCSGSEEASRELVKRYGDRIRNHIQTLVPDIRDAEDLSQEVFAKAFQMIGSYDPQYAFSTWIYTLARNRQHRFCEKTQNKCEAVWTTLMAVRRIRELKIGSPVRKSI